MSNHNSAVADQITVDFTQGGPVQIVDSDVHTAPRSPDELREYLPRGWEQLPDDVLAPDQRQLYAPQQSIRGDAVPDEGPAGSDPDLAAAQLLGDAGIGQGYAMLISPIRTFQNREVEAAVCSATNAWLADTWLSAYNAGGHYWGSISICLDAPALACPEIERWAGHERMKQVKVNSYAEAPFGDPRYDPIYETASRLGMPIGVHFAKGSGTSLLTPVGYLPSYVELHSLYPMSYLAHLVSLIFNGTFERFPDLKYVFIEGGFTWVGPLLWRMDRYWEEFRYELPLVRRRPSEYVLDHVRFTSQPIEEPGSKDRLSQALDWAQAERLLLFATDYPHWDFDDPGFVTRQLPTSLRDRVLWKNALEFYDLPPVREPLGSVA
jgi:predicted TIM-barrel fold metal-dependent hydrolase